MLSFSMFMFPAMRAGSVSMCIFGEQTSQQSASSSTLAAPSATSSPSPLTYITITVTVAGVDASACLAVPACTAALVQALGGVLGQNVSSVTLVASGSGEPPTSSNTTASSGPSSSRRRSLAVMDAASAPRILVTSLGGATSLPTDALSAALFSAVSSDPYDPLWVTLQVSAKIGQLVCV
jgi:hypothetical protein